MNGHMGGGGGRGSQRGSGNQNVNGESAQLKSGNHAEAKKPSFELQSTSFPPLPSKLKLYFLFDELKDILMHIWY